MHSHLVCEFLEDNMVLSEYLFPSFLLPILGSFVLDAVRFWASLGCSLFWELTFQSLEL